MKNRILKRDPCLYLSSEFKSSLPRLFCVSLKTGHEIIGSYNFCWMTSLYFMENWPAQLYGGDLPEINTRRVLSVRRPSTLPTRTRSAALLPAAILRRLFTEKLSSYVICQLDVCFFFPINLIRFWWIHQFSSKLFLVNSNWFLLWLGSHITDHMPI